MRLLRFFPYYGSKIQLVSRGVYPEPKHEVIIEPFAGSAGYSLNYPSRKVILNDKDETIYGLWKYLINVSEREILSFPVGGCAADSNYCSLPQEAKNLIEFWNNPGSAQPTNSRNNSNDIFIGSAFALKRPDTSWCASVRNRIADQLQYIRHWEVYNKEYYTLGGKAATWFIDPPYRKTGGAYKENFIIYEALGDWCKRLRGQVIVCEEGTANWLPFKRLTENVTQSKKLSSELIWEGGCAAANE